MQQPERRVLVLPLTRRDGEVTLALLARAGLEGCVCDSVNALIAQVPLGVGAILLTEAALCDAAAMDGLLAKLARQPTWSDVPVVALVRQGAPSPLMAGVLDRLSNATLLDRPASTRSMLSAVQSALRARQRQYQMRDQLQDQVQAQAALRRSEENFRVIVDLVPDLLWSNAPDGRADWYNGRWNQYTGQDAAALLAPDWMAAVHPEDLAETRACWQRAIHAQQPLVREHRIRRHDGAYRWHLVRAEPLRDAQGRVVRWFGSATDIHEQHTARELLEERVRQRTTELATARDAADAASRSKSAFLAHMSHEFRTPLNAVIGLSQLLERMTLPERATGFVQHIRQGGEQLLALTNDVLDLSRIEAEEMTLESVIFEPRPLLETALALVQSQADAKSLHLVADVASELPERLVGDPLRLRQILLNLLSNAVKFTQAGSVTLRAGVLAQEARPPRLCLEVADTGIGIAPEQQEHIFEPFAQADGTITRRFGGSGLGLSIVRHLVLMMDGSVSVRSQPGHGSCFTVELPLNTPAMPAHPDEPSQAVPLGLKVLVADDNEPAAQALSQLLLLAGCETRVVTSGRAAIEEATHWQPAVAVLDIGMPDIDGHAVVRQLHEQSHEAHMLLIAMTGWGRDEERLRSLSAGFNHHLTKPVDIDELMALITTHEAG